MSQDGWLPDPLVGEAFLGRFAIEGVLRRSRLGTQYRATQLGMGRLVTVEVVCSNASDSVKQRFLQEMRVATMIEHPNSVRVYEYGETPGGDLFLILENLDGRTLEEELVFTGPFSPRRTAQLGCQIAAALAAAHAHGVHRADLQPASILLVEKADKQDWVKVVDFGFARLRDAESRFTASGGRVGSAPYMAPEYVRDDICDARTDLYALGCVLYEVFTGKKLFSGNDYEVMARQVNDVPPTLSEGLGRPAPKTLETIVSDLLAKRPQDRPQSARQVIGRLSALIGSWRYARTSIPPTAPDPVEVGGGRFQLQELMGEGGAGSVWRAHDRRLSVERAVKLLKPALVARQEVRERFLFEAQTMARLDHPHVVRVYDIGEDDGRLWMAMEFCPCGTTRDWIRMYGQMPEALALEVVYQAGRGLQAAHDAGIIHRDMKPHNILIDGNGRCKVNDFGIARSLDSERTATGMAIGTMSYMAPEQRVDAKVADARADVYGLGSTLYHLVVGETPMDLYRHEFHPDVLTAVPRVLRGVIAMATRYDREKRYPSVAAFLGALDAIRSHLPTLPPGTASLVGGKRAPHARRDPPSIPPRAA